MFNELQNTTWINPSEDKPAKFKLFTGSGKNKFINVEIPPLGKMQIPSQFDSTIRKEKDGLIVAGKCPWLIKEGEEKAQLHSSLDYEATIRNLELEALADQIRKKKSLEDAIALLEGASPKKSTRKSNS